MWIPPKETMGVKGGPKRGWRQGYFMDNSNKHSSIKWFYWNFCFTLYVPIRYVSIIELVVCVHFSFKHVVSSNFISRTFSSHMVFIYRTQFFLYFWFWSHVKFIRMFVACTLGIAMLMTVEQHHHHSRYCKKIHHKSSKAWEQWTKYSISSTIFCTSNFSTWLSFLLAQGHTWAFFQNIF